MLTLSDLNLPLSVMPPYALYSNHDFLFSALPSLHRMTCALCLRKLTLYISDLVDNVQIYPAFCLNLKISTRSTEVRQAVSRLVTLLPLVEIKISCQGVVRVEIFMQIDSFLGLSPGIVTLKGLSSPVLDFKEIFNSQEHEATLTCGWWILEKNPGFRAVQ